MKNGAERIMDERSRQISEEGWSAEHDDSHTDGGLAWAAVCYAAPGRIYKMSIEDTGICIHDPWPMHWDVLFDKRISVKRVNGYDIKHGGDVDPKNLSKLERIDLLVKAGALIAAEIDRLERME